MTNTFSAYKNKWLYGDINYVNPKIGILTTNYSEV